jgi:hypothetical protein
MMKKEKYKDDEEKGEDDEVEIWIKKSKKMMRM